MLGTWVALGMWGTAALAAGPSYVLVTPETWLSVSPEPTARRLRARALTGLEGYHDTRAVVLERLGARDGMVHVRTVSTPADLGPEGTPASVSMAPADWPHCYTQPAGLAQLGWMLGWPKTSCWTCRRSRWCSIVQKAPVCARRGWCSSTAARAVSCRG